MAEECQGASRTPERSVEWMGNTVNSLSQGFTGGMILLNSTCLRVLVSALKSPETSIYLVSQYLSDSP